MYRAERVAGSPANQCQEQAGHTAPRVKGASIDPVCGMTVRRPALFQADFQDRTYDFCSSGCKSKFVAEPQRYVVGRAAAKQRSLDRTSGPGTRRHDLFVPHASRGGARIIQALARFAAWPFEPLLPDLEEKESPELVDFRRRFWWSLSSWSRVGRAWGV